MRENFGCLRYKLNNKVYYLRESNSTGQWFDSTGCEVLSYQINKNLCSAYFLTRFMLFNKNKSKDILKNLSSIVYTESNLFTFQNYTKADEVYNILKECSFIDYIRIPANYGDDNKKSLSLMIQTDKDLKQAKKKSIELLNELN